MQTVNNPTEYKIGMDMSPRLRVRLIADIIESDEHEETLNELKEKSNWNLFLLWLRS